MDFGMLRTIGKSKLFAFLKGVVDAGVKIQCPEENFPEEDRISGKHLKSDFSKTFKEIKSMIAGNNTIANYLAPAANSGTGISGGSHMVNKEAYLNVSGETAFAL